jgi:hypothetical protein
MAGTQYYVYSEDTTSGQTYVVNTNPSWNGPGVRVGGPFNSQAAAQAFINSGGAKSGLTGAINTEQQSLVGQWIVVPEGEAGKIVQALAYVGSDPLTAVVGAVKGDLAVGGDVTPQQLTTAQQVTNAESAGLQLYPSKAAAQAAANDQNGKTNPPQTNWTEELTKLLGDVLDRNFWLRAGKVIIGGIIIVVGVSKMTGASNVIVKAAEKAPIPL